MLNFKFTDSKISTDHDSPAPKPQNNKEFNESKFTLDEHNNNGMVTPLVLPNLLILEGMTFSLSFNFFSHDQESYYLPDVEHKSQPLVLNHTLIPIVFLLF